MSTYLARLKAKNSQDYELPKPPKPLLAVKAVPEVSISLGKDHASAAVPVAPLPKWQHDLCTAHDFFMGATGNCPHSIDECLISRIIDSGGDLDKLRGYEIGQGVATDEIIDLFLGMNEPSEFIFRNPIWLFCMAEQIRENSHRR